MNLQIHFKCLIKHNNTELMQLSVASTHEIHGTDSSDNYSSDNYDVISIQYGV